MAGAGGPDDVLRFLAGHSQPLTSRARSQENPHPEGVPLLSILDAETGKVLHHVMAMKPEIGVLYNTTSKAAISPDQRLVSVLYHDLITGELIDRRIGIYSTDNWQRIAAFRFGDDLSRRADAIDFSPDGKLLTIAYEDKRGGIDARIDLFSADTCKRIRSIKTFQELQNQSLTTAALTFSPDGSMIAIILIGAGAAWEYPNGQVAPRGVGCLTPTAVPESLHVFKVSDGSRVASVGGLGSGFEQHKFEWSPKNNFIEFLDVYEDTYFWDTLSHDPPQEKCQLPRSMTVVTFSPDGNLLSQGFADGVNLYELK